jgi:hypothetical protein
MNHDNMPAMASSTYSSQSYGLANVGALGGGGAAVGQMFAPFGDGAVGQLIGGPIRGHRRTPTHPMTDNTEEAGTMANQPTRRLVQVLIMDPNENVPLESCLLYRGEQKLTDATDQELFFELDIKDILAKHNVDRVKLVDKKVKERTEYLEPAKIRDLKMVVVTVAEF